jgi:hypothetical protein
MNNARAQTWRRTPRPPRGLYVGLLLDQRTRLNLAHKDYTALYSPSDDAAPTQPTAANLARRTRTPLATRPSPRLSHELFYESRSSVLPASHVALSSATYAMANGFTILATATPTEPPARAARHAGLNSGHEREHTHAHHPAEPTTIPRTWTHQRSSLTRTPPKQAN